MFAAIAVLTAVSTSRAQVIDDPSVPGKGHGSVAITLQRVRVTERHTREFGYEEFGEITLRSAYLEFDYGVTDRLAVTATIPFKSNRYRGDMPHDPRLLQDPRGEVFLDDGSFHSNWGDWGLGVRWQMRAEPFLIAPFAAFYYPSHDYPLFTETQAGTGQWRIAAGFNAGDRFPRPAQNLFWTLGYAYNRMEKTTVAGEIDRHVDQSYAHLELTWLFSPVWFASLGVDRRWTHGGLDFPSDFNPPFDDELFFYHDRVFDWSGTNASFELGRRLGDHYLLSAEYGRTIDIPSLGHKYDPSITVSLRRVF